MPFYSSSPPPLNDDEEDGELAPEVEEFGDFSVGTSCSPIGIFDAIDPPSSFRASPPTMKPAAHHPNPSFNKPVEQSQPATTVNRESCDGQTDTDKQGSNAYSSLHHTNGYAEAKHCSSDRSAVDPPEETGFADFTVFTEETSHPWCCGFSPMSNLEQWDGRLGGTINSQGEQICDSEREVIMKTEPRSHCAPRNKENISTKVKHCRCEEEATEQSSLHYHQPQEDIAATLEFCSGADMSGASQRELKCRFNPLQISEEHDDGDQSVSSIPPTFTMIEAASEDIPSFSEDLSFEGASANLEPNVSSLGSQDGLTDWDQTDVEDELEDYGRFDSEKGFYLSSLHATQENSSTSTQPPSDTHPEDQFADFAESISGCHGDQEQPRLADGGVLSLGNLPPSDSFADFCSAPTQEDEGSTWEFKDQSPELEGKTWAQFRKPLSSLQADGDIEEQDRERETGGSRRNSSQMISLSCRVQQLLQASFPEDLVSDSEEDEDLLSLGALLQSQCLPESEEVKPELSSACWIWQSLLSGHQDVHLAVGLQFQWSGSHVNRSLLSCLGVDTRNIVFMGTRKKPVSVPAFASGLGLLEPTKDSVPAVCSPGHTALTSQAPPGAQDPPESSTHSVQEELPSSPRDWSSRGLSSSQDGTSPRRAPHFWGRK